LNSDFLGKNGALSEDSEEEESGSVRGALRLKGYYGVSMGFRWGVETMRVGIIRCLSNARKCPATSCLRAISEKEGNFSDYGDVELVGITTCGGDGMCWLVSDATSVVHGFWCNVVV